MMVKCVIWDLDNTLLSGVYLESAAQPPAPDPAMLAVLQELRRCPESQARNAQAIRAAWQAGDKKKAIALYSSVYDVDEKTAKATLESTPGL